MAAWYASELVGVPRLWWSTPEQGLDNSGPCPLRVPEDGCNMPRSLSAQSSFGSAVSRATTAGDLVFFKGPNTNKVDACWYLSNGRRLRSLIQLYQRGCATQLELRVLC